MEKENEKCLLYKIEATGLFPEIGSGKIKAKMVLDTK